MSVLRGNNGPRYRHTADEIAPYESISIDKLTPVIGAEIGGVDLSGPLPNYQMDEIHRALAENCVIFFRDQHLTQAQHLAFGRNFGALHIHPAAPHAPGHPELMIIHADKDSLRATAKDGTATFPVTRNRRWAAFCTSSSAHLGAGIHCSPTCMPPMRRYPTG